MIREVARERRGSSVMRLSDPTFLLGSLLVVAALAMAFAVMTREDLPVIGGGAGGLVAVAVVGMAGCAVGGISQAPILGWTAPTILVGIVLGVLALAVVGAGLFGWNALLDPIAQFVPGQPATLTPVRLAVFALAALIALKWLIATGMAALAR